MRPALRWPEIRWAVLAAGCLAIALVALASGGGGDWSGHSPRRLLLDVPSGLVTLAVVTSSVAILVFVAFLLALARHHGKDREVRSALRALLVLPLLAVAVAIALRNTPLDRLFLDFHGQWNTPTLDGAIAVEAARETLPVVGTVMALLMFAAAVASLGLVVWLVLGERLREWLGARPAAAADPLAGAVAESLDDLRMEPDVRLAILRCYRRFELVLARSRVPRLPWQTATEFMAAALGRLPLPADAVRRLTGLFEIARFSTEPLGPADRDAAWEALRRIRASLDEAAAAPRPEAGAAAG
jgi:uncharacterized protein DUF4129